jgi:hypothetical protein
MAKFLSILAASVGGGLLLGASIRVGEVLGGKLKAGKEEPAANGPKPHRDSPAPLLSRLDSLEARMSRAFSPAPEWESVVAGVVTRMDRQQCDVDSIRQQVAKTSRALDSVGDVATHLRSDMQKELSRNLDDRLAAAEARVHRRMEAAHGETLDAMMSAMESRVTPLIVRMEIEIAGQNAAISELRECALQSERSVQRLIGILERMMSPAQKSSAPPGQPGKDPSPFAGTPFSEGREAPASAAPTPMASSFSVLNPMS